MYDIDIHELNIGPFRDLKALPKGLRLKKRIVGLSNVELKKLNNAIQKQKKTLAKPKKKAWHCLLGQIAPKPMIMVNFEGIPIVPSQNQWIMALKTHSFHLLDVTKPIDYQLLEKLIDVKKKLEKQFDYSQLGMNLEHMRVTIGRILKTRWAKWFKIYNASMEVHDEH